MSRENRFLLISSSNQDQRDEQPILHISSNTFHQRKCFIFSRPY